MLKVKMKRGILKHTALIKKSSGILNKHFQTTFSCSLKFKYITSEIENAKEMLDFKNKPKKKKVGSLVLLVVNFLVITGIFVYFFLTNEIKNPWQLFSEDVRWIYLVLAVLMLILSIVIESLKLLHLIYKSTGKIRPWLSIKTHMLGRYYDNITPFAAGGQPFQIFYLNKHGISGDKATSIPLVKQTLNMFAFVTLSIGVLITNIFIPLTDNPLVLLIAIISYIINGALVALILLFSTSRRFGPSLVIKILKLLNKIKIVKNYKVTFFRVAKFVKNYQKSVKLVAKSFKALFIQFILALLTYVVFYAIVYFIYLAFIPNGTISLLDIICCMTLCDLCGSIMPLPGGSGAAELSFDAIFKRMFVTLPGAFPYAMLIWRILTYFIFIGVGGIQIFSSFIKSKIKARKNN